MRRLLIFCCLAILLQPGCAVSRSRVFNVTNKTVDTTAKVAGVSGTVAVGAAFLVVESWWDDLLGIDDDDDDFFEDTACRTDEASEQRVRYE